MILACLDVTTLLAVEGQVLERYPHAWVLLASVVALALVSCIGEAGALRLIRDLRQDDDGKETTAQYLVEVYFWAATSLAVVLLVTAASWLAFMAQAEGGDAAVTNTAQKFPSRFVELGDTLGIDTRPRADRARPAGEPAAATQAAQAMAVVLYAGSLSGLALSLCLLPVLWAAARIITIYEVVQGALRYLSLLFVALARSLAVRSGTNVIPLYR